ncbi:hypothetical protein [Sinorhizobium meliloti]|uniref:hypothetical protein n=1 Tax=Rhizobium meliloti TaxID=382 RepID=UPI0001E4B02F|nr:hypothetical protein [Sinorhizobium meliloti]AEG53173.1 hypothetical protein Sinme_1428 [Sinorhizobium meliloti AK83]MDE4591111.1 hypothetical protein [Sinorhizobium meliloti]SEI56529.1 hypothetical protein SAMN04244575_01077 [Sinorhizobium meliloti]
MSELPKSPIFFPGATSWEFQWFRLCVWINYPRFWRTSGLLRIAFTDKEGNL